MWPWWRRVVVADAWPIEAATKAIERPSWMSSDA
jgi:hypothetical protein